MREIQLLVRDRELNVKWCNLKFEEIIDLCWSSADLDDSGLMEKIN